jgi:hypothetical protein
MQLQAKGFQAELEGAFALREQLHALGHNDVNSLAREVQQLSDQNLELGESVAKLTQQLQQSSDVAQRARRREREATEEAKQNGQQSQVATQALLQGQHEFREQRERL